MFCNILKLRVSIFQLGIIFQDDGIVGILIITTKTLKDITRTEKNKKQVDATIYPKSAAAATAVATVIQIHATKLPLFFLSGE